jgi:hypothetical protein
MQGDNQLYNQDEILRRINIGNVMGEKEYVSIQRMLKSTDRENLKLGMEAMANCDYEKSCVYLLLLMKDYGDKMYGSPTSSHVNFKSLLKFFSVTNINNFDLDDVIRTLLSRKLLNRANLDRLMPLAIEQMKENADTDYFLPADVAMTDEIKQGLSENILDRDCNVEIVEDTQEQLKLKV